MEVIYKHIGKDRPLIHVPNFGNIILKENDVLTIGEKYSYINDKSLYTSNLIHYFKYGFVYDKISFIQDMLSGKYFTPLEIDENCINQISEKLPKENFYMSHYQFSNQVRPTYKVIFDGEFYIKDVKETSLEIAWYIYRNLFKILPKGFTKCDATLYENLEYLYNYNF